MRTNSGQCAALLVVRELPRCGFHLTTIPSQIAAVASRLIATASGISARANRMDAGLNHFDAKPSGLTAMPSGINAISSRTTTIFGTRNALTSHLRNTGYSINYLILRNSEAEMQRRVRARRQPPEADLSPALARWGLIPRWFRKPLKEWKATTINARVETVAQAPSYREAYRSGRCIVPMAGYHEWATLSADPKQPYHVQPGGNAPALLVCGLWSEPSLPDFSGLTCAILTEPARDDLARVHDRQPVIVDVDGARAWLDGTPIEIVPRLPTERLTLHRVSKRVNNWRAEDPDLIRAHMQS